MLYFIVPLRSKKSSLDWNKVAYDFNLTIKSILNQMDTNFKVIVACTDVPDYPVDERIEIVEVPTIYRGIEDSMRDKRNKKLAMCARVRELGGGFIMPVDADDLVSNRISDLVNRGESESGYVANTGYEYDERTKRIRIAPRFYNLCGTSAVIKCTVDELPENMEDEREFPILAGHTRWKSLFDDKGIPLKPFPFKPVIYKYNTGENDSVRRNNIGFKRKMMRLLVKGSPVNNKIREEFAFHE